jgi:hypothetical protein
LDAQLAILDEVGADTEDLRGGIGVDVAVSIEVSSGVDLGVSEICQAGGGEVLGGTITMAVENVDSEDCLLRLEDGNKGRKKEELLGKHLDCLSNIRCGSMKKIHKVEAISRKTE